jgi:hypothetical protein
MRHPLSRRRLLAHAAVIFGLAADAPARAMPEADKVTQADARYRSKPNGEQRCEICLQFLPPNRCRIVRGPISPRGWCQFFAARENAR